MSPRSCCIAVCVLLALAVTATVAALPQELDDDQSTSGGGGGGEHSKEGEKHAKNCLTREACHKKKIICGKGCTLSAHSKCAAKCSKSCVPTC